MKIHLDSSEPDVRVEIIPLIDVIFCILTFFILAAVTLTRQNAINVDLPRASTGTTQMRKLLIVTVDPIGQTYVEKQPVSRDQLYQALTNFRQGSPDGTMVLYASRAASYNDVVQVLDLLQSVGGDRVALATLPGSSPATSNGSGSNGVPAPLPGANGLPGSGGVDPSLPGLTPGAGNSGSSTNPSMLPGSLPNSLAPSSTSPYNPNQPLPSDLAQPSTGKPNGSSSGGSNKARPDSNQP